MSEGWIQIYMYIMYYIYTNALLCPIIHVDFEMFFGLPAITYDKLIVIIDENSILVTISTC